MAPETELTEKQPNHTDAMLNGKDNQRGGKSSPANQAASEPGRTMNLQALSTPVEQGVTDFRPGISFGIMAGAEKTATDCGQVTMKIFDLEIVRGEEVRTLAKSMVPSLWAKSASNGGINVRSWDRDYYKVKACTGAGAGTTPEAQRLLSQVSVSFQDGRVNIGGPDTKTWTVYLLISAPREAVLELEAEKSPIILNGLAGNIQVRNISGPVSLYNVTGEIRAEVVNGPINIVGKSGDYRLNLQNGSLNIELVGNRWEAGRLEGSTQNGPLNLRIPADYESSMQIEGRLQSKVNCQTLKCGPGGDTPNLFEIGNGDRVIRLSAFRGPVAINSR